MKRLPAFDDKKTTEAAAVLLRKSNGRMRYIRLLKLLYLADKEALRRWERPITFDEYVSMKYGQVLSTTYDFIKNEKSSDSGEWEETIESATPQSYFVNLKKMPQLTKLSRAELNLLEETFEKYKDIHWKTLGELTKGSEYKKPSGTRKSIPTPFEKVLRALDYSDDDIERIDEKLEEYSYIQELSEL